MGVSVVRVIAQPELLGPESLVVAAVVVPPIAVLVIWSRRHRWVVKRLPTRHDLDARMAGTRDPYLRARLLWIEYAMAKGSLERPAKMAPAEFVLAASSAEGKMMYASLGTALMLGFIRGLVGAFCCLVGLGFMLLGGSLFWPGVIFGVIGLAILVSLSTVARAYRSAASIHGRKILATRKAQPEERWRELLALAASEPR